MHPRFVSSTGCIAAVAALVLLGGAACSKSETAQARGRDDAPKPVKVERVREEPVRRSIEVVGTLAAVDEVTISSEAEGRVSKLLADLGDRVRAGQTLMELDAEKLQYNLEQQKAALARALAKYGASDSRHLPPIERTPDVVKAQAELVQAKQGFDRAEELHRRQLVPRQTLDDAQTMLQSKQASYDSALQNAKNLRADIDASEATAKLADRQLRDTTIRAPFDGYVQKRLVNLGEYVKVQTPVMVIVATDRLRARLKVPEKMAAWVAVGQPVKVQVEAYPERAFEGAVSRMNPSVDPQTRSFDVEALLENRDGVLKPGFFARASIVSSRVDQALVVPQDALRYLYGVYKVFTVEQSALHETEVKLGAREGADVEILSGLKEGTYVAVPLEGEELRDGAAVEAVK